MMFEHLFYVCAFFLAAFSRPFFAMVGGPSRPGHFTQFVALFIMVGGPSRPGHFTQFVALFIMVGGPSRPGHFKQFGDFAIF